MRPSLAREGGDDQRLGVTEEHDLARGGVEHIGVDGSFEFPFSVDGSCRIQLTPAPPHRVRTFELKPREQRDLGEL